MDKSLKKLSRVELLELMVAMSEEYEDLAAENEQLRQQLSRQRLSKNAKVGSIAEAALQANDYFDAAQRSADEYLREIKRLRDDMVARRRSSVERMSAEAQMQAKAQAQAIIRDAQGQANQIMGRAQAQAQALLNEAQMRAQQHMSVQQQMHAQQQTPVQQQLQDAAAHQMPVDQPYQVNASQRRYSQAAHQGRNDAVPAHAYAAVEDRRMQQRDSRSYGRADDRGAGREEGRSADRSRVPGRTVQMPSIDPRADAANQRLSRGWTM